MEDLTTTTIPADINRLRADAKRLVAAIDAAEERIAHTLTLKRCDAIGSSASQARSAAADADAMVQRIVAWSMPRSVNQVDRSLADLIMNATAVAD